MATGLGRTRIRTERDIRTELATAVGGDFQLSIAGSSPAAGQRASLDTMRPANEGPIPVNHQPRCRPHVAQEAKHHS